MASYTAIDPRCRVVVETEGATHPISLIIRDDAGREIKQPLTHEMLRLLGYTCALHYGALTRKTAFMPPGFAPPVTYPAHPGGPLSAPAPARVRARPAAPPIEQPVPVARTRARPR